MRSRPGEHAAPGAAGKELQHKDHGDFRDHIACNNSDAHGAVSADRENPRPSGAWTGYPRQNATPALVGAGEDGYFCGLFAGIDTLARDSGLIERYDADGGASFFLNLLFILPRSSPIRAHKALFYALF